MLTLLDLFILSSSIQHSNRMNKISKFYAT